MRKIVRIERIENVATKIQKHKREKKKKRICWITCEESSIITFLQQINSSEFTISHRAMGWPLHRRNLQKVIEKKFASMFTVENLGKVAMSRTFLWWLIRAALSNQCLLRIQRTNGQYKSKLPEPGNINRITIQSEGWSNFNCYALIHPDSHP